MADEDIRKDTYPHIYEVLDLISEDAGLGAGHETYSIDAKWEPLLAEWDFKLRQMTSEQRTTFAIGDAVAGMALAADFKLSDIGLMLHEFADGEAG